MRKITFDIETKNFFHDVGSNDPIALDISVVCIHDSLDNQYRSFLEKDFPSLWPILEKADVLITWNGDHFDIPLLNKYYSGDLTKIRSIDMMREARNVIGRRLKLDTVASATLGRKKIGGGSDATDWWSKGEIDKVIAYCIEDVKITKDLYDYAVANRGFKYKDLGAGGAVHDIKLDTSLWEVKPDHAMTYTLPF
ncbi:MAG: ribonuclease H-like domain-containing protein [bacterium]|nr:ribonuclease H-like domain-containing protein [bacterium]